MDCNNNPVGAKQGGHAQTEPAPLNRGQIRACELTEGELKTIHDINCRNMGEGSLSTYESQLMELSRLLNQIKDPTYSSFVEDLRQKAWGVRQYITGLRNTRGATGPSNSTGGFEPRAPPREFLPWLPTDDDQTVPSHPEDPDSSFGSFPDNSMNTLGEPGENSFSTLASGASNLTGNSGQQPSASRGNTSRVVLHGKAGFWKQ